MKKKLLTVVGLVLCAVLLVAGSIFGTFAYLTSKTGPVTNTFTVGNVKITLDEAKVDEYGVAVTPASRVDANEYKLIPGHTYVKDPTIYVDANSEDCWVFVKVDNGIAGIEGVTTIESQLTTNGWTYISDNVWAYNTKMTKSQSVTPFEEFTVSGGADVSSCSTAKITVTAYAVQADGFDTAAEAWAAAPATWTNP